MIKGFPCFRKLERKVVRAKPQGLRRAKGKGDGRCPPGTAGVLMVGVNPEPLSSEQGTWPEAPLPERLPRSRVTGGWGRGWVMVDLQRLSGWQLALPKLLERFLRIPRTARQVLDRAHNTSDVSQEGKTLQLGLTYFGRVLWRNSREKAIVMVAGHHQS